MKRIKAFLKSIFTKDEISKKEKVVNYLIFNDYGCTCKETHSADCPNFIEFNLERDLNIWQKFLLETRLVEFHEWNEDYPEHKRGEKEYSLERDRQITSWQKVIEKSMNEVEKGMCRKLYSYDGRGFASEFTSVAGYHKLKMSVKLKSDLAELKSKIEDVEPVESFYELYLSLEEGDVILSKSGTQRMIESVGKKVIRVKKWRKDETFNEAKSKEMCIFDLLSGRFVWVKEIIKKTDFVERKKRTG